MACLSQCTLFVVVVCLNVEAHIDRWSRGLITSGRAWAQTEYTYIYGIDYIDIDVYMYP